MDNQTPEAPEQSGMSDEELRAALGEIKLMDNRLIMGIAYSMTGDQATQKAANALALQAKMAALASIIEEFYQGRIALRQDENGNIGFEGR